MWPAIDVDGRIEKTNGVAHGSSLGGLRG